MSKITLILFLQLKYGYTKQSIVTLPYMHNNGSFTQQPICDRSKKIDLMSYSFNLLSCLSDKNCTNTKEQNFTSHEELYLHQMCSMQSTCTNLSFPQRSAREEHFRFGIVIDYQCIDTLTNVVHMCQSGEWNISDIVHLIYNGTSSQPSISCRCYIEDGTFVVTLNDVRLSDKAGKRCSLASLRVDSQEYSCKDNGFDFGSIFNKDISGALDNAYIWFNSSTTAPDMVWLKIEPTGDSTITVTCKKPTVSYVSSKFTVTSSTDRSSGYYSATASDSLSTTDQVEPGPSINIMGVLIIVLCLVFLLIVSMIIGWQLYSKHKRTRQDQNLSGTKDEPISVETPEQYKLRSPELSEVDRERLKDDPENQSDDYYSLANIRETNFQSSQDDEVYDITQIKTISNRKNVNYDHLPYFKT